MDNSIKEKITLIPSSELDLFRLLKSRLKVVFDVGARTDLEYYKLHSNCSYHLFEPNEEFLSELYQKLPAGFNHRIKINPFGLSYRNSENNLYYKNSQSFVINPIFKIGIDSGKRYKLQKLDNYVRENKIKHIDFLKIDTEGMDYQVILGGADTILKNKISFIQFEYWDGVRKFSEFLSDNYDLYLMIEPVLLRAILTKVYPKMTISQKKLNYQQSLIKIDRSVIDLIDNKIIPLGFGGNIFGVNKNLKNFRIKDLIINIPTVTFQTQCYENDYEYILLGNRLKHEIENCNYPFTHRILIINKVINKRYVAFLADRIKNAGIIDDYYFAEDYIDKALEYFEIRKDSFGGGYYYARVHLVGLYLCRTDYLMHFTTDSYIENKTDIPWIQDAIEIMQSDSRYACASAFWGESPKGACDEAVYDLGDWYAGYGFSDNCYLVPAGLSESVFITNITRLLRDFRRMPETVLRNEWILICIIMTS